MCNVAAVAGGRIERRTKQSVVAVEQRLWRGWEKSVVAA